MSREGSELLWRWLGGHGWRWSGQGRGLGTCPGGREKGEGQQRGLGWLVPGDCKQPTLLCTLIGGCVRAVA